MNKVNKEFKYNAEDGWGIGAEAWDFKYEGCDL